MKILLKILLSILIVAIVVLATLFITAKVAGFPSMWALVDYLIEQVKATAVIARV